MTAKYGAETGPTSKISEIMRFKRRLKMEEDTIIAVKIRPAKKNKRKRERGRIPTNPLANVKCMECHCVGTVMKTKEGVVLFPNTVKKTLLELSAGVLMPTINKVKPTVNIANQKAKDFVRKFSKGKESSKGEKKMSVAKMMIEEQTKTRVPPDKFRGFLSDEFENDIFWKSNKRLAAQ